MIAKKNINKAYLIFLLIHLTIWTVIPYLTNINLPLDTIEALAWGSNLDWGFNKHPPFSAFAVEFIYQIFGNKDWAYYLLSQIFVISAFIVVFKFSKEFFNNIELAFLSVILLEGILFYNFTTPEFNVNISQLPFWALSIFFTWRCINSDKIQDFILLGLFMAFGFLSKYLFLYLIISIKLFFIYLLIKKKIKSFKFLLVGPVALLIIFPHLIWLVENDFTTLTYGLKRIGNEYNIINHITYPVMFIFKQLGLLLPFLILFLLLIKKLSLKNFELDKKTIFLIFTCIVPILLIFLTSFIIGGNIRTMWMTPFYLYFGMMFIHFFKRNLNYKKLKKFYLLFLLLFFISPITYAGVSLTNDFKRTDYPGKEIARLIQNRWDDNFNNEINTVIGDEWYAGNLSYHLESRPKWMLQLKENSKKLENYGGVIYTGNPQILKNICPGVFGTIRPVGYCMIGLK